MYCVCEVEWNLSDFILLVERIKYSIIKQDKRFVCTNVVFNEDCSLWLPTSRIIKSSGMCVCGICRLFGFHTIILSIF
jgi:hypothetical protein